MHKRALAQCSIEYAWDGYRLPVHGETLIRAVRLRDELRPANLWGVSPPTQLDPPWLAISRTTTSFIVYAFSEGGEPLEFSQHPTLDEAIQRATRDYGVEPEEWSFCEVDLPLDWETAPPPSAA